MGIAKVKLSKSEKSGKSIYSQITAEINKEFRRSMSGDKINIDDFIKSFVDIMKSVNLAIEEGVSQSLHGVKFACMGNMYIKDNKGG